MDSRQGGAVAPSDARAVKSTYLEQITLLSFDNYVGTDGNKSNIEKVFRKEYARQGLAIDRLLGVGSGGVHLLVTLALVRSGAPLLARLTFATAIEQLLCAVLVVRRPAVYYRWRLSFYAFNILWSMISANLLVHHLHFNYCKPAGGALFWASELVNTSLPWLFLHGLVFPLPFPRALLVNGIAVVVLLSNNIGRCRKSLGVCPAGGSHFQALQTMLARAFSIFSVTSTASETTAFPSATDPLHACVATYTMAHIAGYVVAMHALWMFEYTARLSFLSRTEHVDIEWTFEQMGPKGAGRILSLLEFFAVVVVTVIFVQMAGPSLSEACFLSNMWTKAAHTTFT